MSSTATSVLGSLAIAAAALAFPAPASASVDVSTPTLISISDSPKDFRLNKDLRKNKDAVAAAKASDITNATFTIVGSGETAVLEARITVARLLGKKHAYNQAVGLYGSNFQYNVKSDGTTTFNVFRKKHPTCAHTTKHRERSTGVVTISMPLPCLSTGLDRQSIDARTWIHRRPKGVTVGGDSTKFARLDIVPTPQFTSIEADQADSCYFFPDLC